MTAPRAREPRRPPSPPDTLPPRRGGGPSFHTYAVSANGSARSCGHGALRRAAAALLVLLAATAAFAPAVRAQEATALQATMTVGLDSLDSGGGYLLQQLGYEHLDSTGSLSPGQFDYPASSAEAATYTVLGLYVQREGNPNTTAGVEALELSFTVRGAVTTAGGMGINSQVLPKDADFTLHLEGSDWSKSYSLKNAIENSITSGSNEQPFWSVGDVINEWWIFRGDLPPLVDGETVTVRLTYPPTTAPPPPTNLKALPGDRRVTLTWDAPAAHSGVARHEFRYKWRTTGDYGGWQAIPDSASGGANASGYTTTGASDDYPATGYPNLIDHVFQVRAVNALGESGPSNEAPVAPLHPEAPPAPMVSAPANTAGLLEVSWTAVAGASAYEVRYWPTDEDGRSFRTRWTRDTGALIQPLAANTEYQVSVAAREAGNRGPWSEVATARTGAAQSGRPVLSLHLLDSSGSEIGEGAITEGGTVRYQIKATNIRNYHDWGNPALLGHFRLHFELEGDRHPPLSSDDSGEWASCKHSPLMREGLVDTQPSFTQTSATTGHWDFVSEPSPSNSAELGPLTLALGPCGDRVIPGRRYLQVGSPRSACVTIADDGSGDAYDYAETDTTQSMLTERPTYSCADRRSTRSFRGRFVSPPERHDGTKRVQVRVAFSEPVEESPENVGEHGVDVDGGRVTSVRPVGGDAPGGAGNRSAGGRNAGREDREVVWEFEIEPSSGEDLTVALEAGRPCEEEGAICTADGRSLSEGITTTVEGPETGPPALTARFVGMPETHDGESGFRFRVAFSENIGISYRSLREDAFTVTGGRVTGGKRVDGRRDLFEMTVRPETDGDVSVALPAERSCGVSGPRESGAICTKSRPRRRLTNAPGATVPGPASASTPAPLTASFEGMPEGHDGQSLFRFRVAFSEDIGIGLRSLREGAFTVSGGRVTGGRRVDGRRDLFEMTVRPDSVGEVSIALAAGRACAVSGAICTKSRPRRQLTNAPAATVSGPAGEPLTARFEGVPAEHDGESPFKFRVAFSDGIRFQGWMWRFYGLAVSGGRAAAGRRVDDRKDLWELTVQPRTYGDIVLTLAPGAACGKTGAVCTRDGRALSNTVIATVAGPVAVSVADARAEEGTDETIDFAVSLSRASSGTVAVAYATADGTATAGADYTRTSGTLTFAPGETEKTVAVPVLDDAIDEGEETFTLRLSDASGGRIADGVATGTIVNSDPLQKMWLSRFGRTVAGQVVDAVTGRLSGPSGGSRVTLGGRSIDLSSLSAGTGEARRSLAGALGAEHAANDDEPPAGPRAREAARSGSWADPETGHGTLRTLTGRELLLGSSFHLAAGGGEAGGPDYAAWGRVAVGGFDAEAPAEKGTVRLDGEVTTGILGADAEWERWLAGVALSVSEGEGSFDQPGVDSGTVESTLTSVNPYVRYEASDRLSVWGLLGYGTGDMTMTQAANDDRDRIVTRTDISVRLGAAGARGVLLKADEDGGIDLALRGDAFLVQMDWEKVSNETDTGADASRLRLVLEAGRPFALGEGAVLTPGLELGLRHDGGDAETGTGVEVGGRIRYTDAGSGLTVEANARTLIAHDDSGYREWGAGGSVRLDPGASGRGLSYSLAPVWGTPSSGVERLWSARGAAGLAPGGEFEAESRLEGEVGYGFGAFGGRGVVTPYAGLGLAEAGDRTWRAGARWSLAPHLAMSLDGARREPANDDAPEHGVRFGLTLRW